MRSIHRSLSEPVMGTSVPAILQEVEVAVAMAASPSAAAAARRRPGGFWSGSVGFGRRRCGEKLGEI